MRDLLRTWIHGISKPGTLYQLLGFRCFHPFREDLAQHSRDANRILGEYQNHSDAVIRQRAFDMRKMVAEASRMFANDTSWRDYNETLVRQICERYITAHTPSVAKIQPNYVRSWLHSTYDIHPDSLEQIVDEIRQQVASTQSNQVSGSTPDFRKSAFHAIDPSIDRTPDSDESLPVQENSTPNVPSESKDASPTDKKRPPAPKRSPKVRVADVRGTESGPNMLSRRTPAKRSSPEVFLVVGFSVMIAMAIVVVGLFVLVPMLLSRNSKEAETQGEVIFDEQTIYEKNNLLTDPIDPDIGKQITPNRSKTEDLQNDKSLEGLRGLEDLQKDLRKIKLPR